MGKDERFLLVASTDFNLLSMTVESCLRKEGTNFIQNRTSDVVEFEVERPIYYRIVIQRRSDAEVARFPLPSVKVAKGSVLDIWFSSDQDKPQKNGETMAVTKRFLRALVLALPKAPWEDLSHQESGKVKKKWKGLID